MPTVNSADATSERLAPVARWTAEERSLWLDLLEGYSTSLLSSEEENAITRSAKAKEERAVAAVTLAAKMADMAVLEFQFRVYSQSDQEGASADAERNYEQFAEWLERNRPKKRRPTVTARRKR